MLITRKSVLFVGFITLITRSVVPDPFFTLSSFTCAVGIACAFASVLCVCDSLCMLRFPELALVQAYSHVYCAMRLLVAASLDRSALRCADRGRWHEQHLLSSVVFPDAANLIGVASSTPLLSSMLLCLCPPCSVCES